MTVLQTKYNTGTREGKALVHYTANATVTVVGNSSVSTIGNTGLTVDSAVISQIWYGAGVANSFWTVLRGSNTVAVLNNTGHLDLQGSGHILTQDDTGDVVLTLSNAADDQGFIMIELKAKITPE